MAVCGDCPNYVELVEGVLGYDADESRGRCVLCPPMPTGDYRWALSQWTIVSPTHTACALCKCRGCPPKQ